MTLNATKALSGKPLCLPRITSLRICKLFSIGTGFRHLAAPVMSWISQIWQSAGVLSVHASEVDGHSVPALADSLSTQSDISSPHIILADTVFGKGVSYIDGDSLTQKNLPVQPMNWHYLPMSPEEFELAMNEVERFD